MKTFLIRVKSSVTVIILVMISILFFAAGSSNNLDKEIKTSLNDYLSNEIPFRPNTIGYGYDGCIFFIDSNDNNNVYR